MNNGGRLGAGCEIKSEIHNTISYSGPLIIMRKCSSIIIHADVNPAMAKEKTERQGRSKKPKDGVKFASSKELGFAGPFQVDIEVSMRRIWERVPFSWRRTHMSNEA